MHTPVASPAGELPAASLLQLIWLASPALPVGGFSYSEGLEAAVEWGGINHEDSAADWLSAQLQLSLARSDLPVIAAALTAWRAADLARIRELNDWLLQTRETSEMRQQTEQMGKSLLEWLRNHEGADAAHIAACAALPPTQEDPGLVCESSVHFQGNVPYLQWTEMGQTLHSNMSLERRGSSARAVAPGLGF